QPRRGRGADPEKGVADAVVVRALLPGCVRDRGQLPRQGLRRRGRGRRPTVEPLRVQFEDSPDRASFSHNAPCSVLGLHPLGVESGHRDEGLRVLVVGPFRHRFPDGLRAVAAREAGFVGALIVGVLTLPRVATTDGALVLVLLRLLVLLTLVEGEGRVLVSPRPGQEHGERDAVGARYFELRASGCRLVQSASEKGTASRSIWVRRTS